MRPHELSPDVRNISRSPVLCSSAGHRRGATYVVTVVALPILLGVAALAIDLGLMHLAAQRVQNVADTAALAGATRAADASGSVTAADQTTAANNAVSAWQVDTTVTTWGPGDSVPGFRTLGY
ncbi:MAG: pilus assembly protein TadG-related protein, partial [Armatimonadota bacterium]